MRPLGKPITDPAAAAPVRTHKTFGPSGYVVLRPVTKHISKGPRSHCAPRSLREQGEVETIVARNHCFGRLFAMLGSRRAGRENKAHAPERPGICGDAIRERFPFGSAVTRKLEIDADVPSGLDRAKVRTLIENANTLGFVEKSIE